MTAYHYVLIIALTAYIAIRIILWWGNRWKKRASQAYMIIGQHGESQEEGNGATATHCWQESRKPCCSMHAQPWTSSWASSH